MTTEKKQQIEWRRSKVLEYLAQGLNQRQIAEKLQLDPSTISSDVAVLREQSKERIRSHLEDRHTSEASDIGVCWRTEEE